MYRHKRLAALEWLYKLERGDTISCSIVVWSLPVWKLLSKLRGKSISFTYLEEDGARSFNSGEIVSSTERYLTVDYVYEKGVIKNLKYDPTRIVHMCVKPQ